MFAILFMAACAVPIAQQENIVGTRYQDGKAQLFADSKELLVAGLVDEALVLSRNNRFFEAEKRLRQADHIVPGNPRVLYNLGLVLDQVGQSEEGAQILVGLNQRIPGQPDTLIALGNVYTSLSKYPEALASLKEAFQIFRRAGNFGRAAGVARSIASVAFISGSEQEALCYSYEAFSLAPSQAQLASHARILLALNLYDSAKRFVEKVLVTNPGFGSHTAVQHVLALSRFAVGDLPGALDASNSALDYLTKEPENGAEVNAAWYLIKTKAATPDDLEEEADKLKGIKTEVLDYRESNPDVLITWPNGLRGLLDGLVEDEE